jgi:hypothetical protein
VTAVTGRQASEPDACDDTDHGGVPQLTTLRGWRDFVAEHPIVPQLLPEDAWHGLGEADRFRYDEARLAHHAKLLVVATPTIQQVIIEGRRLQYLNRHAEVGRCGLILSGPARTGKTTCLTQLGKTIETMHTRRHPHAAGHIPVVYITAPPAATPRMIAVEFARFLGLPLTRRANPASLQPWTGSMPAPLVLVGDQGGVSVEIERPPCLVAHAVADRFPARTMSIEVAMLEFDSRPLGGHGYEAHLNLARVLRVRLQLPCGADVPAEHDSLRRFVGEDASPATLAAVDPAIEDVTADPRFKHRLSDRRRQQIVLGRLEVAEAFGEGGEGLLDRDLHRDLPTDVGSGCLRHGFSPVDRSMSSP